MYQAEASGASSSRRQSSSLPGCSIRKDPEQRCRAEQSLTACHFWSCLHPCLGRIGSTSAEEKADRNCSRQPVTSRGKTATLEYVWRSSAARDMCHCSRSACTLSANQMDQQA